MLKLNHGFVFLSLIFFSVAMMISCEYGDPLAPDKRKEISSEQILKPVNGANMPDKGTITETEDVFGQGPDGPVVAEDGATVKRTPKGISIKVTMPTPEPGEYEYPTEGAAFSGPGYPEVFTLWAFIFNDPSAEDWDGAFAVAGHVVGGSTLTLSGHISLNTEPFLGNKLKNPKGAEVHLAVAPHGALDAELMPEALRTPTAPGPDIWWLAIFEGEK